MITHNQGLATQEIEVGSWVYTYIAGRKLRLEYVKWDVKEILHNNLGQIFAKRSGVIIG